MDGAPAVDVFVVPKGVGDADDRSLRADGRRLAAGRPLPCWTSRVVAGQVWKRFVALPKGAYYLVVDNSTAAGRTAPAVGWRRPRRQGRLPRAARRRAVAPGKRARSTCPCERAGINAASDRLPGRAAPGKSACRFRPSELISRAEERQATSIRLLGAVVRPGAPGAGSAGRLAARTRASSPRRLAWSGASAGWCRTSPCLRASCCSRCSRWGSTTSATTCRWRHRQASAAGPICPASCGASTRPLRVCSKKPSASCTRTRARWSATCPASARDELKDSLESLRESMEAEKFDEDEFGDAFDHANRQVSRHLGRWQKSELREYAESIGIAVAVALLLRAFVVEAFKIPSGSMLPTLQIQDHIFVNKFIYGPEIPFTHTRLFANLPPKRGDVMVFIYPDPNPDNPRQDFIKRVIALPGDTLEADGGHPIINGWKVPSCDVGPYEFYEGDQSRAEKGRAVRRVPRRLLVPDGVRERPLRRPPGAVSREGRTRSGSSATTATTAATRAPGTTGAVAALRSAASRAGRCSCG